MLWLIFGVFALMLLCIWLEDENRQTNSKINKLVKESRKAAATHKPNNILWPN